MSMSVPLLQRELIEVTTALTEQGISYALIGGLAVVVRGYHRGTIDIDLLLDSKDHPALLELLRARSYVVMHDSEVLAHFLLQNSLRLDVLFARYELGREILAAVTIESIGGRQISVARPEDLIGLKLQALSSNPKRLGDWDDIMALWNMRTESFDVERVEKYFNLFGFHEQLSVLKGQEHEQPRT